MDSGPENVVSTNKTEPWAEQKPYLTYGFGQAKNLYQQPGPEYYPGQTVAGFDPATEAALSGQENRAMSGSPLNASAQDQAMRTMGGEYLTLESNPYLGSYIDSLYGKMRPQLDAQFGGSGRYGSGAHQAAISDAVAGAALPALMQNYSTERQNQLATMNNAGNLASTDYQDLAALRDVGSARTTQEQALINADIQKHNFGQQLPANKLAQYLNLVQGNYGGTSTSTQPVYGADPLGQLLGAGLGLGGMALLRSDRRIKTNVERIGTLFNGFPYYLFDFIDGPKNQMGVMAQDVEKVLPEAVVEIDGVKHVDYGLIWRV